MFDFVTCGLDLWLDWLDFACLFVYFARWICFRFTDLFGLSCWTLCAYCGVLNLLCCLMFVCVLGFAVFCV